MFWAKPFLIFYFFVQILPGSLSQSTVFADIPGNVRFTIPNVSSTLQISTIASSSTTLSSGASSDQTTVNILHGTDTPIPTSSPRGPNYGPEREPVSPGRIAGIVVGAVILLLGALIGAIWYSRSKGRNKTTVKQPGIEIQSEEKLSTKETISKEGIPIQETETVESSSTFTPPAPKPEIPSQKVTVVSRRPVREESQYLNGNQEGLGEPCACRRA